MNLRGLLDNHASVLTIVVDPQHPPEVRDAIESWLKVIRPGQVLQWGAPVPATGLSVYLPTAQRLASLKSKDRSLLVRPLNRDLLSMGLDQEAEVIAHAVIEADADNSTLQRIIGTWLGMFLLQQSSSHEKIAHRNQRALEKEMRQAIKLIAQDLSALGEYLELFGQFLDVQGELLVRPEWDLIEKDLETLARRLDKKKNWRLLKSGATTENKKDKQLYWLGQLKGTSLFVENVQRDEGPLATVASYLVLHSLRRRLRQWEEGREEAGPGPLVEEAFQLLPLPTLLMGENAEVLQHNTAFVKLNLTPSKVIKFTDMDQVLSKGQTWSVRRLDLGQRSIFTFLPAGRSGSGVGLDNGQELGIITSSIAHELNNPLAGLLTALDLMSMDDHWDEESRGLLSEMRQGATRCKQLVDTFLGFSRVRVDFHSAPEKDLLKHTTEQALNLQRFRMVESGLRIQLSHQQIHPYAYPLHAPSLTMAIYLVLGEYLTALHHLKLLERQAAHGLVIEGVVEEDADKFRISFSEKPPRPLVFTSKLLQYLLQQERLLLEETAGGFTFTHQNVLI